MLTASHPNWRALTTQLYFAYINASNWSKRCAYSFAHTLPTLRLHTRCRRSVATMLRTVVSALLLHTTHALAPPAQALRTLAKTSGDDVRGITSPEAENALLPESAYFVGLGFRAWLGDE